VQLNYVHDFNKHRILYVFVQEDSEKTGKVTSAGMYFLHFQVYRMDSTVNAVSKFCNLFVIVIIIIFSGVGMWDRSFHLVMAEELMIEHSSGAASDG
jgi:hypothetical protein